MRRTDNVSIVTYHKTIIAHIVRNSIFGKKRAVPFSWMETK